MVEVFASFASKCDKGYNLVLLCFSTFMDKTNHTADEHKTDVNFVFSCYKKTQENVVDIVGDNCFVDIALFGKVGCPLIEYACHRFNLAIKDKVYEKKEVFQNILVLMKNVKYGLLAARLRRLTIYAAVVMNDTRWSSAYLMLKRYVRIREKLAELDDVEVGLLLLNAGENRKIKKLLSVMEALEKI